MKTQNSKKRKSQSLIIFFILLIAAIFRFINLNWDANKHLHPDERFLTMVSNDVKLPSSIFSYFNPDISSLNPANQNYNFFVYGHFPIIVNKILAVVFRNNNYNSLALQGRFLSASLEIGIVIIIFHFAQQLAKKYKLSKQFKYWAALTYSLFVLSIQQAHFFTVDSFVNFFSLLSLYAAWNWQQQKNSTKKKWLLMSAISLALAISSKINAIYITPLLGWLLISKNLKQKNIFNIIKQNLPNIFLFGLVAYVSLRIADPYLFNSWSWLDPRPHQNFLKNIQELQALNNPEVWFPPGLQWRKTKPVIFALKNTFIFGVGIIPSIFLVIGLIKSIYFAGKKIIKKKCDLNISVFLIWIIGFFLYQSTRYSKNNRYFLIIYPFFSLLAGLGIEELKKISKKKYLTMSYIINLGLLLIWPLMFISIYLQPHSRIQASQWIYQNIPENSLLLAEHWDDALPLHLDGFRHRYEIKELPVFGQDTPQKWQEMEKLLNQADYYILSSNRGWGSIMANADRYPQMSSFYQRLFAEQTPYKKVAEFNSFPSLEYLGIPLTLNDSWAEEAFSVYDHPQVMVFKRKQ